MADTPRGFINNPRVIGSVMTSVASPEQYEGTLADGRVFYFRLRSGLAQLGVGSDLSAALDDAFVGRGVNERVGDSLQGVFASRQQRDEVFARLLDQRLAVAEEAADA